MAWGQQVLGIFQSAWDAIRAVVVRTGLPRRTVYDAVVAAKSG